MIRRLPLAFCTVLATSMILMGAASAQDRDTKVRNDRSELAEDGYWIYNDLPRGLAEARRTSKPLLLVFRCIP